MDRRAAVLALLGVEERERDLRRVAVLGNRKRHHGFRPSVTADTSAETTV
jgi:hypothetical protein